MRVQVHQSGRDIQTARINHIQAQLGGNVRLDRCDLSIHNRQIGPLAEFAARVGHLAVLDQNVIPALALLRQHHGGLGRGNRSKTNGF